MRVDSEQAELQNARRIKNLQQQVKNEMERLSEQPNEEKQLMAGDVSQIRGEDDNEGVLAPADNSNVFNNNNNMQYDME